MNLRTKFLGAVALATLALAVIAVPMHADTLAASWYSMTTNDPDVGVGEGSGGTSFVTTVGGGLGADGLPILNATGKSILHDYNAAGELLWWNTADPHVSVLSNPVYPSTITLPFIDNNMYTNTTVLGANGNDSNAFLTAEFVGDFNLSAPGSVSFNVCSDDDEFVYLSGGAFGNGTMVVDNGGIHGTSCTTGNVNTGMLSSVAAGDYTISIFYADRQHTGAVFQLTANLNLTPPPPSVPEPASVTLFISGLAGIGGRFLRRGKTARH